MQINVSLHAQLLMKSHLVTQEFQCNDLYYKYMRNIVNMSENQISFLDRSTLAIIGAESISLACNALQKGLELRRSGLYSGVIIRF